jgi:hypothetical protein
METLPSVRKHLLSQGFVNIVLVCIVALIHCTRNALFIRIKPIMRPKTVIEGVWLRFTSRVDDDCCWSSLNKIKSKEGTYHFDATSRVALLFSVIVRPNTHCDFNTHCLK